MIETECEEQSVEAKGEFYDLNADPWEMNNIYDTLTQQQHDTLIRRLNEFKSCRGDRCRELHTTSMDIELNNDNSHNNKYSNFKFDSVLLKALL